MLTLFIAGRGTYRVKGYVSDIHAGMVGIVVPESEVGILMADPKDPYEHFYCRFSGTEAKKTAYRIFDEHGGRPFFTWKYWLGHLDAFRNLAILGKPFVSIPERTRPVDAMCAYVLACLDNPVVSGERKFTVFSLERYMQTHLSSPARLDQMASDFKVSKAHLCRVGHSLLDDTILRVWQRMKMEWAQHLLMDRSLSVSEIAYRVGFEDAFYFSKVFKAHWGLSPLHWRKKKEPAGRGQKSESEISC